MASPGLIAFLPHLPARTRALLWERDAFQFSFNPSEATIKRPPNIEHCSSGPLPRPSLCVLVRTPVLHPRRRHSLRLWNQGSWLVISNQPSLVSVAAAVMAVLYGMLWHVAVSAYLGVKLEGEVFQILGHWDMIIAAYWRVFRTRNNDQHHHGQHRNIHQVHRK